MALYRELSCDESVIQRAHGTELVSALAKFALRNEGCLCKQQPHHIRAIAWRASPGAGTNDKPRSDPAIDITACGGHRGWHLSNHRTYRLLCFLLKR